MSGRLFIRSLATNARSIRSPVQLFGLDGTYATALFTASAKATSVEDASTSLSKLSEVIKSDENLTKDILDNPALSSQQREIVVEQLVKLTNVNDASVKNLLSLLAENNRLALLPKISKQFQTLVDAHNGLVQGFVTTAQPLDAKNFKRIEKSLTQSALVGKGKTLKLINLVKPEIKGGLIIEIDQKTVDLSVATKLQKLNKALKEDI
ncbi:hypothetical protein TPHA_0D01870 [Tetrapisispora phaffii CBS 4417]|uniref:ATP synthase subunit 5, mitochondrial n=1 Tax=Tetrapisispora phaffii (strain ATCC 24235 / CBS 4417 / NBRC 1672 / NRRL Y-8282 / UCD 70-5) TaxID=1071381 RepID=G8BSK5_TETPH|nr:hypothetical protein TPHA_0D01870 [Tetrapisispora phaffii CBS 4417]CCE62826.1 hypothetical protein TPHA_0D01870 [Tetrapisispora phaffii CBS 4417]